jgi:hypothetical protein
LVQSLRLPANWEDAVRRLCQQQDRLDPETERKEICSMLRLMRDNYERGLYEGEEYQYWQKVNSLKGKIDLLTRKPESAIERAALTLLNSRDSWEWATREEHKQLVRTMIQEAGCDVGSKSIVWVKVNPDYEILFRLIDGLQSDAGRRYWIKEYSAEGDIGDMGEELGQMATEVKIDFPLSGKTCTCLANSLTIVEEYVQ